MLYYGKAYVDLSLLENDLIHPYIEYEMTLHQLKQLTLLEFTSSRAWNVVAALIRINTCRELISKLRLQM